MTAGWIEALAKELGPVLDREKSTRFGTAGGYSSGYKHDASGTPITTGYSHGPGGLLTFPGVDQDVFHTVMTPNSMLGQLPTMPSLNTDPTFLTITGVTDDPAGQQEKDGVCDDAPIGGLMKACLTHSVFGRYERATHEIELNRLGARVDRADPLDLRLVGGPMGANAGIFTGGPMNAVSPNDVLVNEFSRKIWERNVSIYRLLARQLWTGNPTNNTAGGGYKEMTGLDMLINTGHLDAETGQPCTAIDSLIANYGGGNISTGTNTQQIVARLSALVHRLKFKADRTGITPVRWVLAMRHSLFYELTALWPCAYLSYRCAQTISSPAMVGNIDAQDAIRFRDEMRAGNYLLIDGERWEVVTDDGITETAVGGGVFESDIYIIPMSVVGGRAVTYMEYFQYSNPSINDALSGNLILAEIDGAFLSWPRQTNQCIVIQTKIEPRVIMRTPWLAARLDNVRYTPVDEHEAGIFPDDPYAVDGGKLYRAGPSYHDIWES